MAATINLPRILQVGAGASQALVATLAELGLKRPLLVTDPFMVECGYCARLRGPLDAAGIEYGLFGDCVPDPTTGSVYAALAVLREGAYDYLAKSLDIVRHLAAVVAHDLHRGLLQVARARVVAEPGPFAQDVLFVGAGQRAHVGELHQEALIVRDDRVDLGLLQHRLREPDAIRITGVTPGQVALRALIPRDQLAPHGGDG